MLLIKLLNQKLHSCYKNEFLSKSDWCDKYAFKTVICISLVLPVLSIIQIHILFCFLKEDVDLFLVSLFLFF